MRPPALASALIAAAAPSSDYEFVAGDLHEEYLRISHSRGAKAANRWYWEQTVLSIPALLSYSRSNASMLRGIGVALMALAVLVAMLAAISVIDTLVSAGALPTWAWVCIDYANAAIFGAILSWVVRTDGLRVAFFASVFLVLCFVVPALAGHPGSQAPLSDWLHLFGAVPVMCIGAGIVQAVRRRKHSVS